MLKIMHLQNVLTQISLHQQEESSGLGVRLISKFVFLNKFDRHDNLS